MKTINCETCGQPFESWYGRIYCSDVCKGTLKILRCVACKGLFASGTSRRSYCDRLSCIESRRVKAPAIYRFICPDGRSYVGAVINIEGRRQ
jgi:hypothetical protein